MQSNEKKFKDQMNRIRQKITLPKFYDIKEVLGYFQSHPGETVEVICVNGISTKICSSINQAKEFYEI